MKDVKVNIKYDVVPDDGKPGIFWRNGERWDRTKKCNEWVDYRLLDAAPNLEKRMMEEDHLVKGIIKRLQELSKQGVKSDD